MRNPWPHTSALYWLFFFFGRNMVTSISFFHIYFYQDHHLVPWSCCGSQFFFSSIGSLYHGFNIFFLPIWFSDLLLLLPCPFSYGRIYRRSSSSANAAIRISLKQVVKPSVRWHCFNSAFEATVHQWCNTQKHEVSYIFEFKLHLSI